MFHEESTSHDVIPSSPLSETKIRQRRIQDSYFEERQCDHWECDLMGCLHTNEPSPKTRGPLHKTLPPTSVADSVPLHSGTMERLPPHQKRTQISSHSSIASTETRRPSLAGFIDGARDIEEAEAEDLTEQSVDEKSLNSGITAGSAEFKMMVRNIRLVDNMDQLGLYTGTLDKRTMRPHGKGTMTYDDIIYEGQWVGGDWCGFGRITHIKSSDAYQGGFFDNMKHGLGVMEYSDGRIYDGRFLLGELEGKGKMEERDGTEFWGCWNKEGIPHGRGKKKYPDGKVYDGEFDEGALTGHGRMTFPDGTWYLGEWCDGQPNGLGMKVNGSGDLLFEGLYSNGEPIEASSMPHQRKSSGQFLLYRNSIATNGGGTLVGPLPRHLYMRHGMSWALKNL